MPNKNRDLSDYRRITILLREDSCRVNFRLVYRLWCQGGF